MPGRFLFKKIDSPELLQDVFRLRYQVYCRERHFIHPAAHPLGIETDAFDAHSVHFGAFDSGKRLAGAVRLILPGCEKFPIEKACKSVAFGDYFEKRQVCSEISRLTISRDYYRTLDKTSSFVSERRQKGMKRLGQVSPILFGLCRALYFECKRRGILFCLALMEPSLQELLRLHSFVFYPIGGVVEYFGKVRPYVLDVAELGKTGIFEFSSLHEFLKRTVETKKQIARG